MIHHLRLWFAQAYSRGEQKLHLTFIANAYYVLNSCHIRGWAYGITDRCSCWARSKYCLVDGKLTVHQILGSSIKIII